ncbi:LOW QUALITY PROTEIN: protein phosphatase 2C 29-like [Actinidia eriantha]|uniref:LOW QUALITY PROTEIN: protein phosphatase 2C 29-like n=1 Tax=Actinidia eriantha TaxID=165200 RepID=UPI00258E19E1|nr:LOW QUALITY PROTEIN: protein phosphatase 2C 29-like [Actinidia eriantha]
MGSGFSQLFPCFNPAANRPGTTQPEVIFTASEPLDETLGHSFCYVRSSSRFLSPTPSDRFVSPSHSLRFSPSHEPVAKARQGGFPETGFKAISGASVSANSYTPRTVLQLDNIYDDATDSVGVGGGVKSSIVNGFESTSSFSALPLQPVPRGGVANRPVPMERAFFMSGPIERGALSGPLEPTGSSDGGRVPFSAPLGGIYVKKKRKKGIPGIRKAFARNFSEKKRPWVVPVRNFVARKEVAAAGDGCESEAKRESNVQWALGKAGEDRVHVVVSEEHGWLFVGIYDGFNGPDAPEFLMGNLYKAVFNELEGLFWDSEEAHSQEGVNVTSENAVIAEGTNLGGDNFNGGEVQISGNEFNESQSDRGSVKKVTFQSEQTGVRRKRLWEFLAEDDPEDGLDLSGSERFAFSVDDAISLSSASSAVSRRSLLLSKLKHGLIKHKESGKLFPWKFGLEAKEKTEAENRVEERSSKSGKKRKVGPVDHDLVMRAISRALEVTELGYLDMTDKVLDQYPELALMGSCLLVVLMRDEDVYVMNVGDSRAIVAQYEPEEISTSTGLKGIADNGSNAEDIVEETTGADERVYKVANEAPTPAMRLTALQLSTDHSTSIEEEVIRIRSEHPDDSHCIVNDRVKGRLKVTRAFGAGFLKQPKLNDALLEMFRNEYIGTAPYISCSPSLRHHKLCPRDQFLVLSSDGLYQYLSNQEVVSHVESFMEKFPDGDPAQHLIEELLLRAAKKAGMDLHELLDIPQGDRRKYHDDVTVMVISLEGRIWKSSGKYV